MDAGLFDAHQKTCPRMCRKDRQADPEMMLQKDTADESSRTLRENRNGTAKSPWPGATISCTGSRQVSWLADHHERTPSRTCIQ